MKIIIIGAGEVGFQLAKVLSQENQDITVIENDSDKCIHASEQLDVAVLQGSGTSGRILIEAGVKDADIVVAATDIDEVNIVICMLARKLSQAKTIARVRNHEYTNHKGVITPEQLGIDLMINPEQEVAREIIQLVRQASATELLTFGDEKLQLLGLRITSRVAPAVGKTLRELSFGYPKLPFRVVAIDRQKKTIIPKGEDWIHLNDTLYIISQKEVIPDVLKMTGKENEKLNDVMILGGGKIGRFVAQELEQKVRVKLIESNKEKSQRIAEQLSKTLVISGDGTDYDLLAREDVMNMDCYIALTQDDENNIISSLLAKHLGVKRVIVLVNKLMYLPIIFTIGIDATFSKALSTVDAILRFIRRGKVLTVSSFKNIDAEIIEFVVSEGAKITKTELSKVKFAGDAIVGAIIRDDKVLIPIGSTRILPNDKTIVFAVPEAVNDVEKFFS